LLVAAFMRGITLIGDLTIFFTVEDFFLRCNAVGRAMGLVGRFAVCLLLARDGVFFLMTTLPRLFLVFDFAIKNENLKHKKAPDPVLGDRVSYVSILHLRSPVYFKMSR